MDIKNDLLNNMFDERWNNINLYHFLNKLTGDEITKLMCGINCHGFGCYSSGTGKYNINIVLVLLLPIFMKKKQVLNNDYYYYIASWAWMDRVNYYMYEKKIEQLDLQMAVRNIPKNDYTNYNRNKELFLNNLKKYKRHVFI